MWLSGWRRRRERKALTRSFSRYLPPKAVDAVVDRSARLILWPARAHVGYVLAQVRDDALCDIPTHFRRAVTVAREVGGLAELAPPLLFVFFGLPSPLSDPNTERRADLAARLIADLGTNVKLVTGHAAALYGNFGDDHRLTYGAAFEGFGAALAGLGGLDYGRSMEI
jgi:hypothetical protein